MNISKIQKGLVLITVAAGVAVAGCELIVDFDRTKIPPEVSEASIQDAGASETSTLQEAGAGDADARAEASTSDAGDAADAADQ